LPRHAVKAKESATSSGSRRAHPGISFCRINARLP
jgi:hypothetical protein